MRTGSGTGPPREGKGPFALTPHTVEPIPTLGALCEAGEVKGFGYWCLGLRVEG